VKIRAAVVEQLRQRIKTELPLKYRTSPSLAARGAG